MVGLAGHVPLSVAMARVASALALIALAFMAAALVAPAHAEKGKLLERLTPDVMAVVFPGAERLGPEEGTPPAIAVYKGDKVVAYIFSTLDIIAPPGYSTTPFDVIAGVEPDGRITGAKVIFHREPYVYHDPVRQPLLDTFLADEAGKPMQGGVPMLPPDYVAQSTITARLMRAAVHDTARMVLHTRLGRQVVSVPTLDMDFFELKSWDELIASGAVGAPAGNFGRGGGGAGQGGRRRCRAGRAARQAGRPLCGGVFRAADADRNRRKRAWRAQFRGLPAPHSGGQPCHFHGLEWPL